MLFRGLSRYSQRKDIYECLHMHLTSRVDEQVLMQKLQSNVSRCTKEKTKAIWLHLSKDNLNHCRRLLDCDFKIHHAIEDSIVMYRWLKEYSDMVPQYSKFYAACGAVAVLDQKLLVVRENSVRLCVIQGVRKGMWGIPSGHITMNEPISTATERQFFEETNMKSRYSSLLYMREIYGGQTSQYYFVGLLHLLPGQQKNLRACPLELDGYEWVDMNDLKMWTNKKNVGLQAGILSFLSQLYEKGFDFEKSFAVVSRQHRQQRNNGDFYFKQHRLARAQYEIRQLEAASKYLGFL